MKGSEMPNMDSFLVIGHRGACGYEPENTLRSFEKAIALGAHMVELDVHRCRTGELVVIHDNRLERTTNGSGYVAEKTLDELRALDAGGGERIPLLREVVERVGARAAINIELKGAGTAGPVSELIERTVGSGGYDTGHFLVSSFDHRELARFAEINRRVRIGALVEGVPLGLAAFAQELGAFAVNAGLDFVTDEFVADAHRRGMRFFVYTVNHSEDIDRMRYMGVDGIFTNYPDRASP